MVKLDCLGKNLWEENEIYTSPHIIYIIGLVAGYTVRNDYILVSWVNDDIAVVINLPKLCKVHKWYR